MSRIDPNRRSVSVVVLCGIDSLLHDFMLAAMSQGMTSGDYVYISTDLLPSPILAQRWVTSPPGSVANTALARQAYQPLLQVRNRVAGVYFKQVRSGVTVGRSRRENLISVRQGTIAEINLGGAFREMVEKTSDKLLVLSIKLFAGISHKTDELLLLNKVTKKEANLKYKIFRCNKRSFGLSYTIFPDKVVQNSYSKRYRVYKIRDDLDTG